MAKLIKLNKAGYTTKFREEGEESNSPNNRNQESSNQNPLRNADNEIVRGEGDIEEDDTEFIRAALGNHFLFKDNYDTLM